jgi:predicted CopG family antitoxin
MNTTIPVSDEVKKRLEKLKGGRTWDEFLESLVNEIYRTRRERNRKALGELFVSTAEEVRTRKWAREY